MNEVKCPVCIGPLSLSTATSRKARNPKVFIMLVCPEDGRHFRGFITDSDYVGRVHARVKGLGSEDKGT